MTENYIYYKHYSIGAIRQRYLWHTGKIKKKVVDSLQGDEDKNKIKRRIDADTLIGESFSWAINN